MENQNILTIKFNTLDDLAVQVADWNERLNHQCCGNCHDIKEPSVTVYETIDVEAVASKVVPKVVKEEKASTKTVKAEHKQDVPVTDFEGNPTKSKKEVEPVAEPEPAKATKIKEAAPVEIPCMDGRRWCKSKKSTCNF